MNEPLLQIVISQAWQIAVLTIAVAGIVGIAAKNRPHLAHALWVLVLIKCVTPPLWGHSLGVFSQLQARLMPDESVTLPDVSGLPASVPFVIEETLVPAPEIDAPDPEPDKTLSLADTEPPEAASLMWGGGTEIEHGQSQTLSIEGDTAVLLPGEFEANTAHAEPASPVEREESDASWLRSGWLFPIGLAAGSIMTLFIMVFRCMRCLREIRRHRTTEFDAQLCERIQYLSKQLRIRRIPQIIVADVLFGPAVLGLLRHTIVLPRCLFTSMKAESGERKTDARENEQHATTACNLPLSAVGFPLSFLDPILAHELLHIRRGDLRTGTLQAIVQSLWWFHPVVWFSNRWLSREAERCCDEQVIAELGCSPGQYARSLLSVIECKHQLQPIPVFPGMKPVEITSQRMERIMSLRNGLKKRTPLWCWLTVVALAIVVLPGAVATPSPDESPAIVKQASSLPITPPTASVSKQQYADTTDDQLPAPATPNELIADERIQPTEMARPVPEFVLKSSDPLVKLVWDAREASRRRLLMTDQRFPWLFMHGLAALRRDFLIRDCDKAVVGLDWLQNGPENQLDRFHYRYQGPWFQKTEHGAQPDPRSVEFGFDDHAQEFVATLAINDVALDTKFKTGDGTITMGDLVKHLQMTVSEKKLAPWTLIALSKYLPRNEKWTNARGEEWSIERLVEIELIKWEQTLPPSSLMSLAVARKHYFAAGESLEGNWLQADQRIREAIDKSRSRTTSDGTLITSYAPIFRSPRFQYRSQFGPPIHSLGSTPTYIDELHMDMEGNRRIRQAAFSYDIAMTSSAQTLLFLTIALPDDQLHDDWFRRAIETAANDLVADWSNEDIASPFYETTQAMTVYLQRVAVAGIATPVPSDEQVKVFVKGLVRQPGSYVAPADKSIRLLDAIALAGGPQDDSAEAISVIRNRDHRLPQSIRQVNLHRAQRGNDPNFFLAPGDEVLLQSAELVKKPLTESIRLDRDFALSPETPITGTTVVAFVNDRPITVEYLLGSSWVRLEQIPELTSEQKTRIALASIKSALPQFLFEEAVLQYFHSSSPEDSGNTAHELRHDRDEQLARALPKIQDNAVSPRSEDDEFFATLLTRDAQVTRTQRQQLVARYTGGLPERTIARDKDAVLRHCRQLVLEAQLRKKVSLNFDNTSLSEVLRSLAKNHGVNIAAKSHHIPTGSRLSARPATVTYHGQDQVLGDAINAIVEPFGLCMKRSSETVMIELADSEQALEKFRALPGPPSFAVYGIVKNTGWQLLEKEIRLRDAITLAGGVVDPEGVAIEITNPEIMSGNAIPVSMSLEVLQHDESGKLNRIVKDGDIISVTRNGSADTLPAKESGAGVMSGKGVNYDKGLAGTVRFDQPLNDEKNAAASPSPVVDKVVVPSTQTEIEKPAAAVRMTLATYPVADLVFPLRNDAAKVAGPVDTSRTADSATASIPSPDKDRASDNQLHAPGGSEKSLNTKFDFAPLTELIKASIDPYSWQGRGTIAVDEATLSLVIRQSQVAHGEIAELLTQLRDAQDQSVQIPCLVVHLTKESQTNWLEEQCSLHSLEHGSRWALLPQQRCELFTQALLEQKPEVLSRPRMITISGQTTTITVGQSAVGGTPTIGIRLEVTPHVLPYSNVIRLQHSFAIGEFTDSMPKPIESLVGSGQTLLLLVNDPENNENTDAARSQYLLMMTPEYIPPVEEEGAVAGKTPKES